MLSILILLMLCPLSSSSSSFVSGLANSNCPSVLTAANIKGWKDVRSTTPINNKVIKVLVPWKMGFEEFVQFNPTTCMLDGFSVQVFCKVLHNMGSDAPSIHIFLEGDGITTPSYNGMVDKVSNGIVDAIVADLTITKKRMEKVGFTLPYLRATFVMVTRTRYASEEEAWDFLKPFSPQLWMMVMVFFVATGVVLFVLENNNPDFNASHVAQQLDIDHQAFQKRCFMNAFWFTSLCVFAAQQEKVRTHWGRIVTVSWLLVMFIMFNASYTASLTSLFSLQRGNPVVQGVQIILKNESIKVGYQEGSFVESFLQDLTRSRKNDNRLKAYKSTDEYTSGLLQGSEHGGVDAIIDELPNVLPLLNGCNFIKNSNDDQLPSFGGYGFAFAKNSTLINRVSKEILALIENATIEQLRKDWRLVEHKQDCNSSQLVLRNFGGLFAILVGGYLICIIVQFATHIKRVWHS